MNDLKSMVTKDEILKIYREEIKNYLASLHIENFIRKNVEPPLSIPNWMTIGEFAKHWRMSNDMMRILIKNIPIPVYEIPNRKRDNILIDVNEADKILKDNPKVLE